MHTIEANFAQQVLLLVGLTAAAVSLVHGNAMTFY